MKEKPTSLACMFQGTGSDVGKSLMVAALARALLMRGFKVAPFKPQNMSNNAAVTLDGGEIGRAQYLQAMAAKIAPTVHMNPILLKPEGDGVSQVIMQGKIFKRLTARDYYNYKPTLLAAVMESYHLLQNTHDAILVEGAGSPAEANLRAADIANMGFADCLNMPVILVADIDRGGALASIVGTLNLLSERDKSLIKGYIINKFRGDISLFDDAITILKDKTNLPCLGVLPYFDKAHLLPSEDALSLEKINHHTKGDKKNGFLKIAVPRFKHIANFDDIDPLKLEDGVEITLLKEGDVLPPDTDMVLLLGSKTTLSDMDYMRAQGWDVDIISHARRGGWVVGLCGGYQMLGNDIYDNLKIEGDINHIKGLGLLNISTNMRKEKKLSQKTRAHDALFQQSVSGYEIHLGKTEGPDCTTRPFLHLQGGKCDGAIADNGRIMGCYLHGIFNNDGFRKSFLNQLRTAKGHKATNSQTNYNKTVENTLDALAQHVEQYLNIDEILKIAAM